VSTCRKEHCAGGNQQREQFKPHVEITVFTKSGGPLTKRIWLLADGSVKSDGSACVMSEGVAERAQIVNVEQLATLIKQLAPNQAIALGALRTGLPQRVQVITKARLKGTQQDFIARTGDSIIYRKRQPTFALLDYDTKGMPEEVAAELKRLGGYWPALLSVLPALRTVAYVMRRSTSAGLSRPDTGEKLPGGGLHIYVVVQDGSDIERFLRSFHDRCWLAGLGWMMVGAGGQLLDRSIVDRCVGSPERLVFEGGPILVPPLQQDRKSRRPVATGGEVLDTVAACPPLTIVENAKLSELKAKEAHRLSSDAARVRAAFIAQQATYIIECTGMSARDAERVAVRQRNGILLPAVVLPFDETDFAGCTVADVLADPDRFDGATMADPLEGIEYGRCKAKIMRRPDGTPWIHSFAHGRTVYELKLDASAVREAMEQADSDVVAKIFVELAAAADLDDLDLEGLRNLAAERSGANKRTISAMLNAVQKEHAAKHADQERKRRFAERTDPRPQIMEPALDAPWLPQMGVLNDVLGGLSSAKPPTRDIDGVIARVCKIAIPNTHAFTPNEANVEEHDHD
jgi:hypothetical protein